MASHGVLVEGQRVNVTSGKYKGKAGQIEKVTAVKVQVRLDGGDQAVPSLHFSQLEDVRFFPAVIFSRIIGSTLNPQMVPSNPHHGGCCATTLPESRYALLRIASKLQQMQHLHLRRHPRLHRRRHLRGHLRLHVLHLRTLQLVAARLQPRTLFLMLGM